jgi:hypothetical protein
LYIFEPEKRKEKKRKNYVKIVSELAFTLLSCLDRYFFYPKKKLATLIARGGLKLKVASKPST